MKTGVKKLKMLIVDDHKLIRDGIKIMLESQKGKHEFTFSEAESGEDAIEKTRKVNFNVIIMDYKLPKMNGAETTRLILQNKPEAKILALSNYDEYMYIDNMIVAGAKGFVLKNIGLRDMITAIETILNDKNYYSNDIAVKLINTDRNKNIESNELNASIHALSRRELEILQLIASEYTNEEIASKLFLSKRTVDTHRQNLLNKLGLRNTAGLVKYAIKLKLAE